MDEKQNKALEKILKDIEDDCISEEPVTSEEFASRIVNALIKQALIKISELQEILELFQSLNRESD